MIYGVGEFEWAHHLHEEIAVLVKAQVKISGNLFYLESTIHSALLVIIRRLNYLL
jgi:hypothetical protein